MPKSLIHRLARGEPLSIVWPIYVSTGAITLGVFSIPSRGAAIVLIPMFLMAGLVIGSGMIAHRWDDSKPYGRYLTVTGLALMMLALWTRAFTVWGVDQHGAGSTVLATANYLWVSIGVGLVLGAIWIRGLS